MEYLRVQFNKFTRILVTGKITACLTFLLFFTGNLSAQVSTLKLSTTTSASYFDITNSGDASMLRMRGDGRLGINQASPTAGLHMVSNDGLLIEGTYGSGNTWTLGAGTRMHWYSSKAAFRAGRVIGTEWDDTNVGNLSFATGDQTTASGSASAAMGYSTTASGTASTAMGFTTTASNSYSTAMGTYTTASGSASTAMGTSTTASGANSTAMGYSTTASGDNTTAMGSYVSTNSNLGAFIIGDNSSGTTVHTSSAPNEMTMRFAGGYKFYTNSGFSIGASLAANGNSWSTISDSTKKENYLPADGESFLNSIAELRLGSWNYKGQNPKDYRHYGPMAQEIFSLFGNDGIGIIGCDTLLATADMDGIMMIAIQALGKRTDELRTSINDLRIAKEDIRVQKEKIKELEVEAASQKELVNKLLNELNNVKNVILELKKEKSGNSHKMASFSTSVGSATTE